MIQRRHRGSSQEASSAIIDDVKFVFVFVASYQTGKKEIMRVYGEVSAVVSRTDENYKTGGA